MTRTSRTARPFFIWFRPQKRVASCAGIPAYQEIIHPPGMGTGRVIESSVFIDLLFVHGKWSTKNDHLARPIDASKRTSPRRGPATAGLLPPRPVARGLIAVGPCGASVLLRPHPPGYSGQSSAPSGHGPVRQGAPASAKMAGDTRCTSLSMLAATSRTSHWARRQSLSLNRWSSSRAFIVTVMFVLAALGRTYRASSSGTPPPGGGSRPSRPRPWPGRTPPAPQAGAPPRAAW